MLTIISFAMGSEGGASSPRESTGSTGFSPPAELQLVAISGCSELSTSASGSASATLSTTSTFVDPTAKAPPGFFNCKKCLRQLSRSVESANRPGWCVPDENSYVALSKKWGRQRPLKQLWDTWGPQEQAEWFRKHQVVGQKRKFDILLYSEKSQNVIGDELNEVDDYETYDVFAQRHVSFGKSMPQIEKMWKDLVEDPATEAMEVRGQWLVPHFKGLQKVKRNATSQVQETARSANIASPAQLAQLQNGGKVLLEQFARTIQAPSQQYSIAPATSASAAEQPVRQAPTDVVGQQVVREAKS